MIPVETVPGIGEGRIKESSAGSMICLIHCKNLYECYNVPRASTTVKM
jgi:hypothetical protein